MNELVQGLIREAEEALKNRKYIDAGRCYEKAAETIHHKSQAAKLLRKASGAYRDSGMYPEADRCYQSAVQLLNGEQKAECIMDHWKDLIDTIVHFEYDCSFEWRGETDGSHDSYQEDLNQYQKKAEDVLKQALSVKGVDKNRIIEKASDECKRREKEGGWGASRCWDIIRNVT
jgi:tetratricopeptide (TPR) repeat protein